MKPVLLPPVAYQGGKKRLAPSILEIVSPTNDFWDVCCGSGAVTLALIERGYPAARITMVESGAWGAFWKTVTTGDFDMERFREIVKTIPSDLKLIQQWARDTADAPVADCDVPYVFVLLQAAAFGGKAVDRMDGVWKHPGFRSFWEPTETSERRSVVNPMMPLPATIERRVADLVADSRLREVTVKHCDAMTTIPRGVTVYVDPPYLGTQQYNGRTLDLPVFIEQAQARGCDVWVSEAKPLLGGESVRLSKGRAKGGISGARRKANQEHLTHFTTNRGALMSGPWTPFEWAAFVFGSTLLIAAMVWLYYISP